MAEREILRGKVLSYPAEENKGLVEVSIGAYDKNGDTVYARVEQGMSGFSSSPPEVWMVMAVRSLVSSRVTRWPERVRNCLMSFFSVQQAAVCSSPPGRWIWMILQGQNGLAAASIRRSDRAWGGSA